MIERKFNGDPVPMSDTRRGYYTTFGVWPVKNENKEKLVALIGCAVVGAVLFAIVVLCTVWIPQTLHAIFG